MINLRTTYRNTGAAFHNCAFTMGLSFPLSRHLEHAGGAEPRTPDLLVHCHASILAQACNFGLTRMAQLATCRTGNSPGVPLGICAKKRFNQRSRASSTTITVIHWPVSGVAARSPPPMDNVFR